MLVIQQLQLRRIERQKTLLQLQELTGLNASVISNALNGKRDSRIGTLETLAGALDSSLVVVPNHLLPEVKRLLSGTPIGPDDVPTAAELILMGKV